MEEKKINQRDAVSYEFYALTYWGINPASGGNLVVHYLKSLLVSAFALTMYVQFMIQTFQETNLEQIVANLYFSMTLLTYMCKLLNYFYKRKSSVKLYETLAQAVFNQYTKKQEHFIKRAVRNTNRLASVFRFLIGVCIVMYGIAPFIENNPDKLLPLPGWFPVDVKKYRYLIVIYQMSAMGLGALVNSSIDILTVGLISIGSAHYEIIRDELLGIKGGMEPKEIERKIARCVHHHCCLSDFVEQIENCFTYGILMQFLATIVVICLTGFELMVVNPKSSEFLMLVSYFAIIMNQIILYCWFGHMILIRSEDVREACYSSEWYEYSPEIQKMIFIMMERSKRSAVLTAGKFFDLSLPTLATILRSSYSYLAVLQRLYTDGLDW